MEWSCVFSSIARAVSSVRCSVSALDDEKIAVFRIYQKAITNVARHAKAKNVFVSLEQEQNGAILTINDDGVGF